MTEPTESRPPQSTPTPSKKDVAGTPESVLGQPVVSSPASTGPDPADIIAAARAREAAVATPADSDPGRAQPPADGREHAPLPAESSRRGAVIALAVVALAVAVVVVIVLVVVL